MDYSFFQLYKKSPFQFNNTPFILGAPDSTTYSGKLSDYVKAAINNLEAFYRDWDGMSPGANPIPRVKQPVNGNENEFFLSTNFDYWKELLKDSDNKNAGTGIKKILSELKKCNLMSYSYMPESMEIDENGAATASFSADVALSYYFDVLQVDLIPPSAEDLEARSTDPKPFAGNTVKGFADVVTFRVKVRRNKMLEAYLNGDFDGADAPKICGGLISAAGRSILLEKFPRVDILAGSAYPIIKPAGGDNSGHKIKSFFNSLSGNYYAFCVGTFTPSAAGGSPRTAVYTFLNTAGTAAFAISEEELPGIVTYTDAAEATFAGNDSGVFTPSDVFVLPVEFLAGLQLNISGRTAEIKASKGYYLAKSVVLNSGVYRSAPGRSAVNFGTTVTIGTNKTRVNVGGSLGSETKTVNGAPIAVVVEENIFAELRITKNGGFRISLFVNGSEYDITDDFSVPLTPTNVSKSELQAQKISRLSSFVQQGGGVVAGAAAVAAGIASGGAALVPAVAAGAGAIFSNASGIAKNIADGAPKQAARQNGAADGIGNATTNGGLYFETFFAENFEVVTAAADSIGYACAIPANGFKVFAAPAKKYTAPLLLKVENAKISAGRTDADTEILIESKLNAGALICYGLDALKTAAGV